jgi:uncharacterized protein (TIGR02996 family)
MPDESTRDALLGALDAKPDDAVTLAALADWFEERGETAAAACLRWAARNGRRPGFNPWQFTYGRFYWVRRGRRPIIDDEPAQLPAALWDGLDAHDEGRPVKSFKSYKSARLAYLALILAWEGLRRPVADDF